MSSIRSDYYNLKPAFLASIFVACAVSLAFGKLVLVLNTSGDAPVMTQPTTVFLQNGGSLDFTPALTAGDNVTYSIDSMPGWSTEAFNTSTGNLTGTAETGVTNHKIRATNTVTGDTYDIWLRVHVGTSAVTIDSTWRTANADTASDGTTYYTLDTANAIYTLDDSFNVDGDCFYVNAAGIGIDGNGQTVTYNNATPITIPENSFETVTAWDFTNATNASRYAGTFLDNEVFDGTYSIRFDCPTADNEYIESSGTVTLQPNTTYCFSVMMHYGKKGVTQADAPLIPAGLTLYGSLVGTGAETQIDIEVDSSTYGAGRFIRGIQLITGTFTTGAGTPTYNVRLGVSGGSNSAGDDVYFDLVKITRYHDNFIYTSYNKDSLTISNLTITQGQDAGYNGDAIWEKSCDNACLDGCTVTVNGDDSNCIEGRDASVDRFDLIACTFAQTSDAGTSRDNYTVNIVNQIFGNFVHNTISSGIHGGFHSYSNWGGATDAWDRAIAYNTITLQAKYTNDFAIIPNDTGDLACEIYENTISSGSGSNHCRGIAPGPDINMHDNNVSVQYSDNNQEYGGIAIGGAYAVQHENGYEAATVTDQTLTVTGSAGGCCVRVTNAGSGLLVYSNSTLTIDGTSNPGIGTDEYNFSVVKTNNANLDYLKFSNCTITTNCSLFSAGNSEIGQLIFQDCTIAYIDDGLDEDFCWVNNFAGNVDARVLDCTLADAGTATWMDAGVYKTGSVEDTTSVNVEVANTCTITFTDAGSPVASTAVTVDDEQATEVYSGTTDSNGQITFVAEDWHRTDGVKTDYQTHTFHVTGYGDETADLTSTNKTPTVALTAQ